MPSAPRTVASTRALTAEGTRHDAFTANDWLLMAGPGLIWGASFVLMAQSLEAFAPGVVTMARIVFGCATLALVPAARHPIPRDAWPRIVAVSVTWLALPMTLFPIAQKHIASSLAGMLNAGIPLFAAFVASVLLRRLPGPWQRAGLVVGVVGMIMIGARSLGEGGSSVLGVVLVIAAIACYGVAINLSVPLTQAYGSVPIFWRCQLVAVPLTLPLGLFGLTKSHWSMKAFLSVAVLGVFGTAIAFVMMTTLAARVGSTRSSFLTYLEAVVALVLGVLVRHEPLHGLEVAGCAVILFGAWLAGRADTDTARATDVS